MPESQKNVGENHAVSGLKFRILRRFLDLGYAVLLSDVDIVSQPCTNLLAVVCHKNNWQPVPVR